MKTIQVQSYSSPCGDLLLGSFENKLCLCDWMDKERREAIDKRIQNRLCARYEKQNSDILIRAVVQLDEYFAYERKIFDIPLLFTGTEFQQSVWQELLGIPYGRTVSYGELARKIGNPKAARAVAVANGANPIPIFVPCHRVIGSNRQLVGYGGGLAAKTALLNLEREIQLFGSEKQNPL